MYKLKLVSKRDESESDDFFVEKAGLCDLKPIIKIRTNMNHILFPF